MDTKHIYFDKVRALHTDPNVSHAVTEKNGSARENIIQWCSHWDLQIQLCHPVFTSKISDSEMYESST